MSERVDIANQALTMLGARPITGFEDETSEALLCKTHYGPCRDVVLEDAEWSFARKQFQPAALSDAPLYGYETAYEIPADIIRVVEVAPAMKGTNYSGWGRIERQTDHMVVGRTILANEPIVCSGIERIEGEGRFTPSFIACLVSYLAYRIAPALTESNSKREGALQMYLANLKKAEALDGQSNTTRRLRTSAIVGRR